MRRSTTINEAGCRKAHGGGGSRVGWGDSAWCACGVRWGWRDAGVEQTTPVHSFVLKTGWFGCCVNIDTKTDLKEG